MTGKKKHSRKNSKKTGRLRRAAVWTGVLVLLTAIALALLSRKPVPARITYGLSFNASYAEELGLDPHTVFTALLDDLNVRHFRLSAHWTAIEPERNRFDFSSIDWEVASAKARGADIILAIGRRLPRWPECHVPGWAAALSWNDQKKEIREYLTAMVERYKNQPHIIYWQVENEPYLDTFARDHCGDLDEAFLKEEIALVRELDPSRPILVTDGGNFGTWAGAYRAGDAFGTSEYVYFWNPTYGQFRTILPPVSYRIKENIMKTLFGDKPTFLIELSLEPWLIDLVANVPIEIQLARMGPEKFDEIIAYAKDTRFDRQYLWGGEWWYWLRGKGHPAMWEKAKMLFAGTSSTNE